MNSLFVVRIYEPDENNPCYVCSRDMVADMDIVLKGDVRICKEHQERLKESIERRNSNPLS